MKLAAEASVSPRRSGLGGALERRERCAMLAPESAEKRAYLSLSPAPRSLAPLGRPAGFVPPLASTWRCTASSSFLAAAFSERACRVIAITCARGHVYVRTYVRECARACMRACTSGGLMGPANDYWPADLGGTSSPAGAHLHKRARACARACVRARETPVLH